MALKDTWTDKVDGVDDVLAEHINGIAHSVIILEDKDARLGTNNFVGRLGYYYSHIDTSNKKIYLTATQGIPQIGAGVLDTSFQTPAYEVGDSFSLVNNAKYEHTATIAAINHNVITYNGTLPFTTIADATGGGEYNLELDDYSFSVPSKANVGVAVVKIIGFAVGERVYASGNDSAGFGRKLLVLGDYGLGSGYNNIVGYCSIVGGTNNDIIANYSLVGGAENTTEGLPTSVIIGGKSHTIKGSYGVTVGQGNTVSGNKNIVGGAGNTASGDENIVGGGSNTVSHARNLVVGIENTVSNQRNIVGGTDNDVSGQNNQVGGSYNNIKTHNCSASGKNNTNTTGDSSIIGGEGNAVSGNASGVGRHLVAGHTNTVSDIENIVGGENNQVSSARCVVGGQRNVVTAKHGLTCGTGNKNNKPNSIVGGTYNNPSNNSVISIGNGASDTARSNAFEVLTDGSAVFGNNFVGLRGFYWSAINTTNKTITLSSKNGNYGTSQSFNIANYWAVNDIISIHSNQKWTNCSKITAISGNVITVDSLPFSSPTAESGHITDQAVFVLAKPDKGLCDFGQYSVVFGESNKAENYAVIVAGRQNEAIDQYAAVFGRQNVGDYACLVGGRNNEVRQEFGFASGSDNYITAKQSAATGKANFIINEAFRSTAMGAYNTIGGDATSQRTQQGVPIQKEIDGEYQQYNPGQYGVALGFGNDIRGFVGVGIGDRNVVSGQHGVALGEANQATHENATSIGYNNKAWANGSVAIGEDNTTQGLRAVSIGYNNQSNAQDGVVIGHGSVIGSGCNFSVSVNGTLANKINYGLGQMIFGSGNTIDTRAKISTDKHSGSGQYNYILGGDACTINGNAHQCVVGGKANTASGYRSTIFGDTNNDKGYSRSTLFGFHNLATADNQTVIGKYATPSSNSLFTVGNGADGARSNAFEVLNENGVSSIKVGNTVITEAQLQKILALIEQ